MSRRFEELAFQPTRMGDISLRRRFDPALGGEVYEAKLDDEFLMSSAFTAAEVALARRGLGRVIGTDLDIVVGGLGLGYTAVAVMEDPRVRTVTVVEALGEVIAWHRDGLLPDAAGLQTDPRVELRQADFFACVRNAGFDSAVPGRRYHAVLLDIDHSPDHLLHPSHADFYSRQGLGRLRDLLHPSGVFGLWSDDPPEPVFTALLRDVFADVDAAVVDFPNPYSGGCSSNTVYTCVAGDAP
jgi:spermidine synthase